MRQEEIAVGEGYERGLKGLGPFSWYMRWYLRRRRPIEVPTVLASLGPGPYSRVLDAGCGTGLWLADLYSRGHGHVTLAGVDVSALMVEDARRRLARVAAPGTTVDLRVCSATELPFPDASFDLVMANAMVKHLDAEPLEQFLAEARRVLTSQGRISIWDFGRPLMRLPQVKPANAALELKNLRSSDVLMAALIEAGFGDAAPYTLKRPWRMPATLEGAVATRP
ncbi:MAG: class I SAM-dependent methyltransferase [Coriobacteriia bacterium]|nr:class I SAM-dependent methyltransferase [Coriobacteriia bacterium]